MRTETEIRDILKRCHDVQGFGMSEGPCPLKADEVKNCVEDCHYVVNRDKMTDTPPEEMDKMRIQCCEDWNKGCCAECSFPSALMWVLGNDVNGSDNGQNNLINALKGT